MSRVARSESELTSNRLLFLTKYGRMGASSRYRAVQYFDYLEAQGFACELAPLFPDSVLSRKYDTYAGRGGLRSVAPDAAASIVRRLWTLSRGTDTYCTVYVESEALPFAPFAVERLLFVRSTRVVVDYGDAITLKYEQHGNPVVRALLASKVPRIMAAATQVIAANRHLAAWVQQFNPATTVIPTSVDLRRYPARCSPRPAAERPVIGWIGTPITAQYLHALTEPLQRLRRRHDFVFKVIGAPHFSVPGIEVQAVPWSETTEVEALAGCDIGVMPLRDDHWSRGKSALKVVQYLASGVAAVASPVGTNCDVLQDGYNGFLASSEDAWVEKLSLLIEHPELRVNFAAAGRRTVEREFSVQGNAPRFAAALIGTEMDSINEAS